MSKKIVSFCLLLVILVTLAVPVFAAEDWYNMQQPYNQSICLFTEIGGTNYYSTYGQDGVSFDNPVTTATKTVSLLFAQPTYEDGWNLVTSNAYDYYVTAIVQAPGEPSNFTFYPTQMNIEYTTHTDQIAIPVTNVKFSHYEGKNTTGFYGTGKIAETIYFGNKIRSVYFTGVTAGTVGANASAYIAVFQVPKSDDNDDANFDAIVDAINSQTETLVDLIQGNGGNPDADETNNSLNDSIDQIDQVEKGIFETAEIAFNLDPPHISDANKIPEYFSSEASLYSTLSSSLFDSLGYLVFFISIPLLLLIVGVFIGKSR